MAEVFKGVQIKMQQSWIKKTRAFFNGFFKHPYLNLAYKITFIYMLVGVLWVAFSDLLLLMLVTDKEMLSFAQTFKGWFFILITALLLFQLTKGWSRSLFDANRKLHQNYEELESAYEELVATEEEIRSQYRELEEKDQALTVLTERYQLAIEGANDAIWDCDVLNNQLYFPRTKKMLGYEDYELEDTLAAFYQLIHPEDYLVVQQDHARYMTGKTKSFAMKYRVKTKSGNYIWILSKGSIVRNETGEIVRVAGSHTDITVAKEHELELDYLAHFDSLTKLPNRFHLMQILNETINKTRENQSSFAVLLLDLDGFKTINDTLGHAVGDLLLKEVSKLILQAVSKEPQNTVARFGGDEFVILLPEIKAGQVEVAAKVAATVLSSLTATINVDKYALNVSASLGIALYPDHGSDAGTLISNADAAMYQAKEAGRGSCRLFSPEISMVITEKLEIQNDLVQALKNNEFVLHYQPIINLANEKITAVEALIRWQHPQKGLIPPNDFIPIAEETGQIINITEWIINKACQDQKQWQDQGFESIALHVNLSAKQFAQNDLIKIIRSAIEKNKLCVNWFNIEITESVAIKNWEQTLIMLVKLRSLGIKVALDDFGTAYSSLQYLKQLPVDILKIDKLFIDDLTENKRDRAIVATIMNLGRNLDLAVVAEGVETLEQVRLLKKMNCAKIQGYYFSKPVKSAGLLTMLENEKCL